MTPENVRAALFQELAAKWVEGDPPAAKSDIAWPNRAYEPGEDAWIRPLIRFGRTIEEEKGEDGLSRREGLFVVNIYAPLGTGTARVFGLAADVEDIFRRKKVGGVILGETETWELGPDEDTELYRVQVRIRFWTWVGE